MPNTKTYLNTSTISEAKPDKRILGGKEKVMVACVQAPQIVFNKEKSIAIACERIKEAAANGAQLVAFSECIPVLMLQKSAECCP